MQRATRKRAIAIVIALVIFIVVCELVIRPLVN